MQDMILLIEDNPDDQELTLRALRQSNIANPVKIIADGAAAIDYLLRQGPYADSALSPRPRVVLLDLKLPKVSGLEVLRTIRENPSTRMLPVVVLSSSAEERDIAESYGRGANSYVRKPLGFPEFAEAVRQMGLYWLLLNESAPDPVR
ncbi:MAG: response regulator [Gemmatimonadaceae bacterium]